MRVIGSYKTMLVIVLVIAGVWSWASSGSTRACNAKLYGYEIVNRYPHDRNAFTQGLAFSDGFVYEGTGRYGYSTVRKLQLEEPNSLIMRPLRNKYFGEGITIHDDRIIQLTWKSRKGFIYDKKSLRQLGGFSYPTQGWGITTDEKRLIISDGTSTLHFLDPNTFDPIGKLRVYDNNRPLKAINELEFVKGNIYANIWRTDRIAIISPENGCVIGWIDLQGLLEPTEYKYPVDVLNGIAYDPNEDRLFVTGKLWPSLFEIKIRPAK